MCYNTMLHAFNSKVRAHSVQFSALIGSLKFSENRLFSLERIKNHEKKNVLCEIQQLLSLGGVQIVLTLWQMQSKKRLFKSYLQNTFLKLK